MPNKGDDLSMFETVNTHDDLINKNILPRLEAVESGQLEIKKEMQTIKSEVTEIRHAQDSLKVTVMEDGHRTRKMLEQFTEHFLEMDRREFDSKERVTMQRLSTGEKVSLAAVSALGGGGLIAAVTAAIELFLK
ncbi:hypothetical protein [Indiicoccus explosivorum]|uniref:hypothetical protein n=1 Tax=Indiicoccus explosivorum TaxID=1917864 RepID=UPI000B43E2B5|nr:hypothetical protein [Indiicoccus explosivorum]